MTRYGFRAPRRCGTGSTRVWRLLVGLLLTAAARPAAAQSPEFAEFHTWTDVATIYNFSERWRYDGDYGLRGVLTDPNWTLLYLRPSVRYRHAQWLRLHGGAALFYNFFAGDDLPELRPWVGVRIVGPPLGGGWRLSNYFRMELRAFYLTGSKNWEVGPPFRPAGNWVPYSGWESQPPKVLRAKALISCPKLGSCSIGCRGAIGV